MKASKQEANVAQSCQNWRSPYRFNSDFWRALQGNGFVCQPDRDVERARIAPMDAIVGADDSSNDDSTIKTRTVQQRLEDLFGE